MGQLFSSQMPREQRSSNSTAHVISKSKVDTLQSRVLKWTIDDITNSKLFETQMGKIPMEFVSTAEYLRAFQEPLLEEVRTQIQQGFERSIKQGHSGSARVTKMIAKTAKQQDSWMRKFNLSVSSQGRQKTTVRYSDLILLCCGELPEWDSRRECLTPQMQHKFVLVNVVYAGNKSSTFTVTAKIPDGSPVLEQLHLPPALQPRWFVVFLGISLIPADRIWNSINETNSEAQESTSSVMQDVLHINHQVEPAGINSLLLPQKPEEAETLQLVEEYCESRGLNESQRDALKSILAGLLSTDAKCHVRLVQGPPGTGKTAMLVPLISVLGCLRWRTLVSAPTNAAVIEVCKRVICLLTKEPEKETPLKDQQEMFSDFWSRVTGLQGSASDSRCSPLQLCDVVLVGSCMGKMGTSVQGNAALEKVFLPYRIERLMAALNPNTGWKGCVLSMEKFLTKAFSQFARDDSGSSSKRDMDNDSFWSFATEFMKKKLAQMEKHLLTLMSELPKCHVDVNLAKAMTLILELVKRILNAMPRKAPVEARTWFGTTKSDALSDVMANLSLSESQRSNTPKLKFLQAREALLTALAVHPGCNLLATKQNPQGLSPKYARLKSLCLEHAVLVFSTVSTVGSPPMVKNTFQCAIIDEASQLVEAESTIISGKRGLKQLVLVGDHKQLPATVISKVAEESGYGRSLFDRLQTLKHGCRHMLNIQYRMKPEISRFPNSQFYESAVKDGPNVLSQGYGLPLDGALTDTAYAFVNCEFGEEESIQKSWRNAHEVAVVINIVRRLGKVCEARHIKHLSIGIISPYAMQVEAVKQSLGHLHSALEVEVKTVDGFQGNERDVIIFTAVRSNSRNDIGFVRDGRRLNVAITRGRYCVWIVGNSKTLRKGAKVWSDLITDAESRNCFVWAAI